MECTNEEYELLKKRCIQFCKDRSVFYPIDFLHDLFIMDGFDKNRFKKYAFIKYKEIFRASRLSLVRGISSIWNNYDEEAKTMQAYEKKQYTCIYRWCYTCSDLIPEREFLEGNGNRCKNCINKLSVGRRRDSTKKTTEYVRLHSSLIRKEIRDSYVIDLLKKNGISKENITSEMIEKKRKSLLKKRKK